MSPLELLASGEFWGSVVIALIGGGGVGGLLGAWASRRKTVAEAEKAAAEAQKAAAEADRISIEADKLAADAARQAADILTSDVIQPLREQINYQEEQIKHLEGVQRKSFMMTRYTRELFHWLQSFCQIVEPDFLEQHPKPRLPDELRPDIAPETIPGPPEAGGPNHTPTGEEGQ